MNISGSVHIFIFRFSYNDALEAHRKLVRVPNFCFPTMQIPAPFPIGGGYLYAWY